MGGITDKKEKSNLKISTLRMNMVIKVVMRTEKELDEDKLEI